MNKGWKIEQNLYKLKENLSTLIDCALSSRYNNRCKAKNST